MKQQNELIKHPTIAIDVGYGNTKAAWAMGAEIATNMFPSLAPLAANSSLNSFGGGVFKGRNVLSVEVDGARYEVGPGVSISGAHHTGRALSEDFATTPGYAALLAGALHYAGARDVERLVLGLPVHNTQKYAAHLKDRFAGTHDFGWGEIHIGSVLPLPQPLGTLINYIQQRGKNYDPENAYLVIDVGYFTTDWVVARGYTVDDTRSGGVPGGAARIYQQVASLISADRNQPDAGIERIDQAIRESKPLVYFGEDLDMGADASAPSKTCWCIDGSTPGRHHQQDYRHCTCDIPSRRGRGFWCRKTGPCLRISGRDQADHARRHP